MIQIPEITWKGRGYPPNSKKKIMELDLAGRIVAHALWARKRGRRPLVVPLV